MTKNEPRKGRPLQVGDLCFTVHTNHPACNDGALVTIVKIDHTQLDRRGGQPIPYLIRRIDGQPHVSTTDRQSGTQRWFKCVEAWCAGYKLKRVDDGEQDARDRVVERKEVPA